MIGFGRKGHTRKHEIDSTIDHKAVAGAVGGNIVTIDPVTKLPIKDSGTSLSAILGGLIPQGTWDASTNTPILADGTGTLGYFYLVSVAGTQNLGSGSQDFNVNDWVLYDQSNEWKRVDNSDPVHSELLGLAWSVAGHTLDTFWDMKYVDELSGNDTTGDGTSLKPYKTLQKAIDVGLASASNVHILAHPNIVVQAITIPAGKTVSISIPRGVDSISGSATLSSIIFGNGSIFISDNIDIDTFNDTAVTTNAFVFMENGEIITVPVANLTTLTFEFHGTTMHPDTWAYIKANAGSIIGNANIRGKYVSDDGFDANGGQLNHVADGIASNDGMAFGQKYTDSNAQTAVQYKPDIALAGTTPVQTDFTAWTIGNRGIGIGTGTRLFLVYKTGATAIKYVELI